MRDWLFGDLDLDEILVLGWAPAKYPRERGRHGEGGRHHFGLAEGGRGGLAKIGGRRAGRRKGMIQVYPALPF